LIRFSRKRSQSKKYPKGCKSK